MKKKLTRPVVAATRPQGPGRKNGPMRPSLVIVAAILVAATACSSGTKKSSTPPSAAGPSASTTSTILGASGGLYNAILAPADLPAGFTGGPFTPSGAPEPCGQQNIDSTNPPRGHAQIDLKKSQSSVIEEVEVYSTATEAAAADSALEDGFTCSSGTYVDPSGGSSSAPVTFDSSPTDDTQLVGADKATAFQMSSNNFNGSVITVLKNDWVGLFIFQSPTGANPNDLGTSPASVTTTAIKKLTSAGV
jgi:hypothetical protein